MNLTLFDYTPADICQNRHKGQNTSIAANPSPEKKVRDKQLILEALERKGEATCELLETLCFLSHQTCSARISELLRDGLIEICGHTKTKAGNKCRLYRKATSQADSAPLANWEIKT